MSIFVKTIKTNKPCWFTLRISYSFLEETTWLALMTHFLSVQYVIKQLGSVKFVILLHLSKISIKTFKESPYFEGITWLALMTQFLNVQYVIKQLVSVKFVILLHL